MKKVYRTILAVLSTGVLVVQGVHCSDGATLDLLGAGWNKTEITVLIQDADGVPRDVLADIEDALDDWNDELLAIEEGPVLVMAGEAKGADIVIVVTNDGGKVLGQTLTRRAGLTGCVLKSAVIRLNAGVFGRDFSGAGLRNLARHELGHALGLGHSDDPADLMYPLFACQDVFGEFDIGISDYDLDGLDAVYPLHRRFPLPDALVWEE